MLLTCEDAKFLGFSEFLRRGVRPDQPRPGRGARRHTRQAKAHSLNSIHRAPRDSTGCGRRTGQPGDWTCRFARVRRQRGVANCAHRVWRPIAQIDALHPHTGAGSPGSRQVAGVTSNVIRTSRPESVRSQTLEADGLLSARASMTTSGRASGWSRFSLLMTRLILVLSAAV